MDADIYLMEWVLRERLAALRAAAEQATRAAAAPRRERTPLERTLGSLVAWTVRWPAPRAPFGGEATGRARPAGAPPLP
jgi:hypothetical protein